jgi:hypothetical protein
VRTLPDLDSRLRRRQPVYSPDGLNERIYCTSCGLPAGYVTAELPPGVIYVCRDCEGKGALPAAAMKLPEL